MVQEQNDDQAAPLPEESTLDAWAWVARARAAAARARREPEDSPESGSRTGSEETPSTPGA